jgi:energy-coupling factor transport system permease protein
VGITFLYHILFSSGDSRVLVSVWGFDLTQGALEKAAFFSSRLILFITVAFLITLTNSPSEIAEAFTRLLRPARKTGLPVADIGLIVFIAMRFIPVLFDEFIAIRDAQLIRGADFGGTLFKRIRKTSSILVPVFVAAISRADDLALALEARGYESTRERTVFSRSRFGYREWIFMLGSTLAMITLYYFTRR